MTNMHCVVRISKIANWDRVLLEYVSSPYQTRYGDVLKHWKSCQSVKRHQEFCKGCHTNTQRLKNWMNREHIVCVMTTNHIQRIDKGLRSRCFEVEFNASTNVYDYVQRMKQIIQQHKMPMLSDEALYQIVERGKGDWRDICSTLQRVCSGVVDKPPTKPKLTIVG